MICNGHSDWPWYSKIYCVLHRPFHVLTHHAYLEISQAQASARGATTRGRGRGRGRGRARRLSHSTTSIDKRPRELSISGFDAEDKDELLTHFSVSTLVVSSL